MKITSKLNELKPSDLNCNVFDVYSYDGLSMQELLCQFFTKINECIKVSNETIDLASWLVNEGLEIEVVKKLMMWLNDGTLENLINVNLFNTLHTKIENINSQLAHIAHDFSIDGWRNLPNVTKKIFFVGDSTLDIRVGYSLNSPTKCFYDKIYSKYTCSGGLLDGVSIYPLGVSGATMEQFITNSFNSSYDRNTYNLDKLIEILNYEAKTYNNLVVFGYGHNGNPSIDKLDKWINDLNTCISRIINETNSFIVLQVPNNRTDLEGTQTLYKTYRSLIGKYPRTELLDTQTLLFGTEAVTSDTSLVGDGIHPTQLGYELRADLLCNFLTPNNVYLKNENPKSLRNDFTTSPNILNIEDKYEKILSSEPIYKSSNNISFWYDYEEVSKLVRKGYILKIGNSKAIELPETMKIFEYGVLEWSSNTSYAAGNIIKCGSNYYECVASGVSGTVMPSLKTVLQDGSCVLKFKSDKKPTVISGIDIAGGTSGLVEIFKVKNYISKYDEKPVHGKWEQGDVVYKSNVQSTGTIGWICTKSGIQDFNSDKPSWREF